MQRIREKYEALRSLIEERMLFEKDPENQIEPYLSHKTTYNYKDVHGYTLLHYASMLNDSDYILYLLQHGASVHSEDQSMMTPMKVALQHGCLEAAKALQLKSTDHEICPRRSVHSDCIEWYSAQSNETIVKSLPNLKDGDFNTISEANDNWMIRQYVVSLIIEQGMIDEVKKSDDPRLAEAELVTTALLNGHFELADYLIERFHQNNYQQFYNAMFSLAAQSKRLDNLGKAEFELFLKKGAIINFKNKPYDLSPLFYACYNNKSELIDFLLENNADVSSRDVSNNNIAHIAVKQKNYVLLDRLSSLPEYQQIITGANIYGYSPVDLAIQMGDEPALKLFLKGQNITNIKSASNFGVEPASIAQGGILNTLHYFLELQYRDTDLLRMTGHCNGFTFLRNLYSELRGSDYFYKTMALIKSWDGTNDSLYKNFGEEHAVWKTIGYNNLYELIEQWCNDIVWFQSAFRNNNLPDWPQLSREKYFNIVADKDKTNVSITYLYNNWAHIGSREHGLKEIQSDATIEMLKEFLVVISKLPVGVKFEITGAEHIVTGELKSNGYFEYYDPNLESKIPNASIDELADIIVKTKFFLLNKLSKDNKMQEFSIAISLIGKDNNILRGFKVFDQTMMPKSIEDAINYYQASPCKFTHLHVCMATGSVESFKEIIDSGFYDLSAEDYSHTNVVRMAAAHPNAEFLNILLHSNIKDINFIDLLHENSEYVQLKEYIESLSLVKKTQILFQALESTNTKFVIDLLESHPQLLDVLNNDGVPFIAVCCDKGKYEIIEYLLDCKVSIFDLYKGKDNNESTPLKDLFNAVFNPDPPDRLLAKIEINCLDGLGKNSLHYACYNKSVRHMKALLKCGADSNKMTSSGLTPLQILLIRKPADKKTVESCVETLLKYHANPNLKSDKYNPIQLASKHSMPECVKLMKTYLITDYLNYLNKSSTPLYRHQFTLFGRTIAFGASKEQEIEAGMAYLKFLNGSIDESQLEPHKKILDQSHLRSITRK